MKTPSLSVVDFFLDIDVIHQSIFRQTQFYLRKNPEGSILTLQCTVLIVLISLSELSL